MNENLDPNEISFTDVMRLIIQLLDDRFGGADSPQVKAAFEVTLEWFREVTKSHQKEIQGPPNLASILDWAESLTLKAEPKQEHL